MLFSARALVTIIVGGEIRNFLVTLPFDFEDGALMGPLVNGSAVEEMFDALEQAKQEGGQILAGGKMRPDLGPNFVEPTIIRMPVQTAIVEK